MAAHAFFYVQRRYMHERPLTNVSWITSMCKNEVGTLICLKNQQEVTLS